MQKGERSAGSHRNGEGKTARGQTSVLWTVLKAVKCSRRLEILRHAVRTIRRIEGNLREGNFIAFRRHCGRPKSRARKTRRNQRKEKSFERMNVQRDLKNLRQINNNARDAWHCFAHADRKTREIRDGMEKSVIVSFASFCKRRQWRQRLRQWFACPLGDEPK